MLGAFRSILPGLLATLALPCFGQLTDTQPAAPQEVGYELDNLALTGYADSADLCCGDDLDCGDKVDCGSCCGGGGCSESTLLGGCRARLQESGITFAGRITQFGFGIDGGIFAPVPPPLGQGNVWKYTGRGEYDFIFDLEKFGGLPHGQLLVRAEHWYGEYGNVGLRSGSFAPPIFPAMLPTRINDPGVPYITNFVVTQPLSEQLVVFAGKKDVLGAADQDVFAGGDGTEQFINQAFIANPAFLLGLPYSSFTMGMASPREWGIVSAFVYDPQDRTADFFRVKDLFSEGVIAGGEVKVFTRFLGKPGENHVGAIWKHHDQLDLSFDEPPPGLFPSPGFAGLPTKSDAYTIYYGFDQYLKVYPGVRPSPLPKKPPRGWGLFGRASISDGNPTPVRYFLSLGVGGNSAFGQQRGDTFGVGWYYVGASDEFGPIPVALLGPGDGTGVELFYNFQVTPRLTITPDLQVLEPGGTRLLSDTALIGGFRINLKL